MHRVEQSVRSVSFTVSIDLPFLTRCRIALESIVWSQVPYGLYVTQPDMFHYVINLYIAQTIT